MKRFWKILTWVFALLAISIVVAYNVFVQSRYSKLPSNKSPSSVKYPENIQRIFWDVEFGGRSMEIQPMPFWRWILNFRETLHTQSFGSPSFKAASHAGKAMLFRAEYAKRHLEFQLDWLFASIWISKHWTAQDVVNTLLAESYFGYETHGLEAASRLYFGVDPKNLTNEEMAYLSGMTKRPASINPWINPDEAMKVAKRSLRMVKKAGNVSIETDPEVCFKRLKTKPNHVQPAQ